MTSRARIRVPSRPHLGCDILVIRATVIENQVVILETSTTTLAISSATHVIETIIVASPTGLCGLVPYSDLDSNLPNEMVSLEYITPLPATSPFLYTDSLEASESSNRPPSQDPYAITVARWMSRAIPLGRPYRTRPNEPRRVMIARKRVGTFPARRLAWRHVSSRSSDHRPSSSSSPTYSLLVHSLSLDAPSQAHVGSSTRVVSPRLGYPPVRAPRHKSSLGDSSERPLHSSSHSTGPSHKRCRSPTDFIPSSTPVTGSLAPTHADLLPPRKRDHIEVDPRDDREEFKASAGDTIMLGIDPRSVLMVDEEIVEPVGVDSSSSSGTRDGTVKSVKDIPVGLDGAIRDIYHHMSEVSRTYHDVYQNGPRGGGSGREVHWSLMDKKLKGNAMKNAKNKMRYDTNHRDKCGQQPPFKRQNTRGQNVARAYTAGNNENMEYGGTLPYCNRSVMAVTTQRTPGLNQRVVTCFECGAQGHFQKDYPKAKNQNLGNIARVPDARGKAYVLGGGHANSGSNTVTDISYTVELANERTSETCTMLRASTLGLLGHPFNIDLMPIDWVVSTSSSAWIGRIERQVLKVRLLAIEDCQAYNEADSEKCKVRLGENEETAFQRLKKKLCSAPILALPEGSENLWYIVMLLTRD
nr:hypothetical protein [Tanacetum cinerariifolium]